MRTDETANQNSHDRQFFQDKGEEQKHRNTKIKDTHSIAELQRPSLLDVIENTLQTEYERHKDHLAAGQQKQIQKFLNGKNDVRDQDFYKKCLKYLQTITSKSEADITIDLMRMGSGLKGMHTLEDVSEIINDPEYFANYLCKLKSETENRVRKLEETTLVSLQKKKIFGSHLIIPESEISNLATKHTPDLFGAIRTSLRMQSALIDKSLKERPNQAEKRKKERIKAEIETLLTSNPQDQAFYYRCLKQLEKTGKELGQKVVIRTMDNESDELKETSLKTVKAIIKNPDYLSSYLTQYSETIPNRIQKIEPLLKEQIRMLAERNKQDLFTAITETLEAESAKLDSIDVTTENQQKTGKLKRELQELLNIEPEARNQDFYLIALSKLRKVGKTYKKDVALITEDRDFGRKSQISLNFADAIVQNPEYTQEYITACRNANIPTINNVAENLGRLQRKNSFHSQISEDEETLTTNSIPRQQDANAEFEQPLLLEWPAEQELEEPQAKQEKKILDEAGLEPVGSANFNPLDLFTPQYVATNTGVIAAYIGYATNIPPVYIAGFALIAATTAYVSTYYASHNSRQREQRPAETPTQLEVKNLTQQKEELSELQTLEPGDKTTDDASISSLSIPYTSNFGFSDFKERLSNASNITDFCLEIEEFKRFYDKCKGDKAQIKTEMGIYYFSKGKEHDDLKKVITEFARNNPQHKEEIHEVLNNNGMFEIWFHKKADLRHFEKELDNSCQNSQSSSWSR